MKNLKLLTLLGVIIFTTTLTGCGNKNGDLVIEDTSSQTDATIKYNDNLVDSASSCIASENIIRDTYDNENSSIEDIKTAINNTIKECTTAKKNINSLGDREGDSSLKDGILNIIEKYIKYYTKFSEILPYLEQEEITEEQNQKYEALLTEIESLDFELNQANENLITIQEQFAKNHGFELEANEEDTLQENVLEDISYEEENKNEIEEVVNNEVEEISNNETEVEATEDEIEE